jgi:uridine kinase
VKFLQTVASGRSYYAPLTHEQLANVANYNFDEPAAFDWRLLNEHLAALEQGKLIHVPRYDFATHSRRPETDAVYGAEVVILEGIVALDPHIVDRLHVRVFVDAPDDIRLIRRLRRDTTERARSMQGVIDQYLKTVKESYERFQLPTRQFAHIIIPGAGDNQVAIEILTEHIRSVLRRRGHAVDAEHAPEADVLRAPAVALTAPGLPVGAVTAFGPRVHVCEQTSGMRAIQTTLRDVKSSTEDFRFAVDRMAKLVMVEALSRLPSNSRTVMTPTNAPFQGQGLSGGVCAVSIVRGGDPLAEAVRELFPSVALGKIVIQQSSDKSEGPRLFYTKIPVDLSGYHVLLLDAVVSTGNVFNMALHVLADHGVLPERVIGAALLAAPSGVVSVCQQHQKVTFVAGALEEGLDGNLFAVPGLGRFGDRYYGVQTVAESQSGAKD